MYLLKVKDNSFTIPKTNIKLLAQIKAIDLHKDFNITTNEQAIEFLNKIGITVEDYKEV